MPNHSHRRTGLLAKKLGMTRFFDDAGQHVPVTVLSLEGCQVTGQRTQDRDGYVALQLGAGARKAKNVAPAAARPVRQGAGRAQGRGRGVPPVGRGHADRGGRRAHRRPLRSGPEGRHPGHHHRQGLRRRHEALELRRAARHPRRFALPPRAGLHRPAAGSGQDLQEQEDGRPPRRRDRHHPEPHRVPHRRRARADHDQGRGARRGRLLRQGVGRGEEGGARGPAGARRLQGRARRLPRLPSPPETTNEGAEA